MEGMLKRVKGALCFTTGDANLTTAMEDAIAAQAELTEEGLITTHTLPSPKKKKTIAESLCGTNTDVSLTFDEQVLSEIHDNGHHRVDSHRTATRKQKEKYKSKTSFADAWCSARTAVRTLDDVDDDNDNNVAI